MRAASVAELLSVDELSGAISLQMNATGRAATASAPQGSRGIKLTASVSNHQISFYEEDDERTDQNSLQLSLQTDTACYVTLVTINSAGDVLQLLPNPIQEKRGFLPDGYLQSSRTYLIPDSFHDGNSAGFHMDYSPPAGTDTVRAFCATDLSMAEALRANIAAMIRGEQGVSIGNTLISSRGLTGLRPNQKSVGGGAWGTATLTITIAANQR
jgi:hypothetical protein